MRVSSKSLHMLIESLMPGQLLVNYLFACCPACLTLFCLHPKPDQVEGDLLLGDMGQGLPLRTGCFDGAISISALQWLCNADRAGHEPRARLRAFFTSLYRALTRGSRAVLQVGRMVLLRMGFLLCARLVRWFICLEPPPHVWLHCWAGLLAVMLHSTCPQMVAASFSLMFITYIGATSMCYALLCRAGVVQIYPENAVQAEMMVSAAMKVRKSSYAVAASFVRRCASWAVRRHFHS